MLDKLLKRLRAAEMLNASYFARAFPDRPAVIEVWLSSTGFPFEVVSVGMLSEGGRSGGRPVVFIGEGRLVDVTRDRSCDLP